ncbi:MAG TPA: tetratricopeptide repeat protein [Pyrinomonadaceae bacterium]|nr:tetratricopeptide repeat protein [Pyrinomonadaceae bacterium]
MPKIRISETAPQTESESFSVSVTFDDSDTFNDLTVSDPFSPQDRAKLEWHFEHFVNHPYLKEVESAEADNIIRAAGENLFTQLFGKAEIYNRYSRIADHDLHDLTIEISGSPDFQSLNWEVLKAPNLPNPFALESLVLRTDTKPQDFSAEFREAATINLLLVTSRPAGRRDVGYRTISRPLVELFRDANLPVKVHILRPATYESLSKHLDTVGKGFYHAVHFDVHGALLTFADFEQMEQPHTANDLTFRLSRYGRSEIKEFKGKDAFLFFDLYQESGGQNGFYADPVRADELAQLLKLYGIPLIILNACQSAKELGEQEEEKGTLPIAEETSLASRLVEAGAQMVLAMAYSVTVSAAKLFMENLYEKLSKDGELAEAVRQGRRELFNQKQRRAAFNLQITLEDWLLPVVYQKRNIKLKTKQLTPAEEEAFLLEKNEIGEMPDVAYGFHGRDIDILDIERRILLKNNILLIRGMGGAGKTTLLEHLAWWWRASGFIGKIFYFGYDRKAYTRQEIVYSIAEQLYERFEFAAFQAMDETAQLQKLADRLRRERHLLILDNLESVQGGYFAVKNTLNAEEQTKLKDFVARLRGKNDPFHEQTIVLLGSRGAEEWLADKTFNRNIYDLGGLDAESATQFAEKILKDNEVSGYSKEPDFGKLMKLLAGFPLPMKVIFENLRRQTPTQILDALKAGDIDLNTGNAEEKTSDILKCIEYSHSNIAPEKQELLLSLAPFTSVVNRHYFEHYIEELKKHEALAHLDHTLWDEVFTESVSRGLMSLDERLPVYHLQPVLPYFLKTEWQKNERTAFKQSVQTAFRDYYDQVSNYIWALTGSKEANDKMLGQFLASLEFENIDTCLEYSLLAQSSIENPYFSLSGYYDAIQNHQAGLILGEKVFERMEQYPKDILEGEIGLEFVGVLHDIATRQLRLKQYKLAESSYQRALSLHFSNKSLNEDNKKKGSASIYHQLGMVASGQREYEKAERYYKQALEIKVEFNDRYSQTSSYFQLGRVAHEQREYEKAESCYKQALELCVEFNDRYSQASTYHQLGMVTQEQREYEKAERYYKQALEIKVEFNDRYSQAKTYHQLGNVASEEREYEKAERYYKQALEICVEFNDRYSQARIYHQLGIVAHEQREYEKAERYYKQALEICVEFNDRYEQAGTFGQFGFLKQAQEKFSEAQSYFLTALEIFRDFNDSHNLSFTFNDLYRLWKESGDDGILLKIGEILEISEAEVREFFQQLADDIAQNEGQAE